MHFFGDFIGYSPFHYGYHGDLKSKKPVFNYCPDTFICLGRAAFSEANGEGSGESKSRGPGMITKFGICSKCGNEGPIPKPSKMLCIKCNEERLQEIRPKKVARPIKQKRKITGEAALFLSIWLSRPHICTNCKCYLGNEMKTFFFSHILSKGAHPEKRLDPLNIQLLCQECHHAYDFQGKDKFNARKK